ncbi:MAG: hypothetical protein JRD89_03555 [Deltaproteobacteria bacterium]|nr:hypothetical protein [Deltaproteobacteria bacterium]
MTAPALRKFDEEAQEYGEKTLESLRQAGKAIGDAAIRTLDKPFLPPVKTDFATRQCVTFSLSFAHSALLEGGHTDAAAEITRILRSFS